MQDSYKNAISSEDKALGTINMFQLAIDHGTNPNNEEYSYRVIPGDVDPSDVVMSHGSVNFDRTGFQQDLNVCFPLERLRELEADGVIGSVADFHYSLSGAVSPVRNEDSAREIARMMKREDVDAVLLVPI